MECRLPRFLLRQAISSVNINREVFKFVPLQDFSKVWTDEELFEKYGLTDDDISYIVYSIKPVKVDDNNNE